VSTRSKLQQVEGEDGACFDTWKVSESSSNLNSVGFGVVNDERTTSLAVASASQLTFTSTKLAGGLGFANIVASTNCVQETKSSGRSGDGSTGEDLRIDDKGDFRYAIY